MSYQFSSLLARRLPKESREYRNIERTVGIWTQFAATGNPYSEKINGMDTLTIDPVRKSDEVIKCLMSLWMRCDEHQQNNLNLMQCLQSAYWHVALRMN